MGFEPDSYEEVSRRGTASAGGTLIGNVDEFSVRYARWYVDAYGFLLSIGTTKNDGPSCAAMGLFESDGELSFQVAAASWEAGSPRAGTSARTAEYTFKEVTEVANAAAEISEFNPHIAAPIRWRPEIRTCFPVLSQFVILLTFLWIRKDAVGFIYFFKLFLRVLISGIDVRVVLSSKLPVSITNLLVSSLARKPKCFVIVPERDCHFSTICWSRITSLRRHAPAARYRP